MPVGRLADDVVARLYRQARADRWEVALASFAAALERSVQKACADAPGPREFDRHLESLHLEDLALACACADGHERAWEHFVREYRPALYRAADAIDSTGGSRDLADSLYADLFGLADRDGERRSLFAYFHGRSSLATWLRAVLARRHVDRVRSARRFEPLPPEGATDLERPVVADPVDRRYVQLMRRAVAAAAARLAPKDRLRLALYYAQQLTLAQIGLALGEHEATASRNLARARREIRTDVERQLRDHEHMRDVEIEECFASVIDDVGSLDVGELLGAPASAPAPVHLDARKETGGGRSKKRTGGASA